MGIYVEILIRAPMDAVWEHTQNPAFHRALGPSVFDNRVRSTCPRVGDAEVSLRHSNRLRPAGQRAKAKASENATWTSGAGCHRSNLAPTILVRSFAREAVTGNTFPRQRVSVFSPGMIIELASAGPVPSSIACIPPHAGLGDRVELRPSAYLARTGHPAASGVSPVRCSCLLAGALAFVFAYHGLVPKLLFADADELAMLRDARVPFGAARAVISSAGLAELVFAVILLAFWHRRWPLDLVPGADACRNGDRGDRCRRATSRAAFNPIALNVCVVALALVDLLVLGDAPSAAYCLRKPPPGEE